MASPKQKLMKRLLWLYCIVVFLVMFTDPQVANARKRKNKNNNHYDGGSTNSYKRSSADGRIGYNVEITQELTHYECDEYAGVALLGKANNVVVDKNAGRALCKFFSKKEKEFHSAMIKWEAGAQKLVDGWGLFGFIRRCWNYWTLRKPHFFITVKTVRWYPFFHDRYHYSRHKFSATFNYELPRTKLFDAFEVLEEQFSYESDQIYPNGRSVREISTEVDILVSPVISAALEDRNAFTQEWFMKAQSSRFREPVNLVNALQPRPNSFSMKIQDLKYFPSKVSLEMKPNHLWHFGETCNAYDGRFIAESSTSNPKNSVCTWMQNINVEDAANYPGERVMRDVVIDVYSADFFHSESAVFCGNVKVTEGIVIKKNDATRTSGGPKVYSRLVCFFADNNPFKQREFKSGRRIADLNNKIKTLAASLRNAKPNRNRHLLEDIPSDTNIVVEYATLDNDVENANEAAKEKTDALSHDESTVQKNDEKNENGVQHNDEEELQNTETKDMQGNVKDDEGEKERTAENKGNEVQQGREKAEEDADTAGFCGRI